MYRLLAFKQRVGDAISVKTLVRRSPGLPDLLCRPPVYVMFVLYLHAIGKVTIPGEITFQLNTDPATDPPVFTLTCTSTGGPATTVSWRRDGTMLSDDSTYSITSQVTDTETATYTHTLTVTGRLVGEYQCSVSNTRTLSGSSRSLAIAGKECNILQRKHTCTQLL